MHTCTVIKFGLYSSSQKSDFEDEDELMKQVQAVYFCLPKADVEMDDPFLPMDE